MRMNEGEGCGENGPVREVIFRGGYLGETSPK